VTVSRARSRDTPRQEVRDQSVVPLVTIGSLKRRGLLEQPGKAINIPVVGYCITASFDADRCVVEFSRSTNGFISTITIQIVYRELKFGYRPYFVCLETGEPCLTLIFVNGEAYSPDAYRRLRVRPSKRKKRMHVKASRRAEVLVTAALAGKVDPGHSRELAELATLIPLPKSAQKALARCSSRQQSEKTKRLWDERELGTVKAMDCGIAAGQFDLFMGYVTEPPGYYATVVPEGVRTEPLTVEQVDRFPALDIRVLASRLELSEGEALARTLGWPSWATDDTRLLMIRDLRDAKLPMIMIGRMGKKQGECSWQRIVLLRNDRNRWFFRCPATGKRCEILYYRNGVFASRAAQRLYNLSQRSEGRARIRQRQESAGSIL
jgi:hypothetical protein